MANLSVWCEGWALSCCNDQVATVGSRWRPSLVALIVDPISSDAPLGWSTTASGDLTSIVGKVVVDRRISGQPVIDAGRIRVAMNTSQRDRKPHGRFSTTTRVFFDWHADIDPALVQHVAVEGLVEEVLRYEPIHEPIDDDPKLRRFVGWREPVPVDTTANWHGFADAVVRLGLSPS